jgi:hypothetical protein
MAITVIVARFDSICNIDVRAQLNYANFIVLKST